MPGSTLARIASTAGVAMLCGTAHALTITLDMEVLKDQGGVPFPSDGLVVLTAAMSGSFYGPTPASFAGGDELVLKKWDLRAFAMPGIFSDIASDLTFAGNWNEGDPLKVYWYPTLTLDSTAPGADTPFGTYRDAMGIDGSARWFTPASSGSITLRFFTSEATFLTDSGSNSPASARATSAVVPEPGVGTLLGMALGVMALRRRRTLFAQLKSQT